MAEQVKRVDFYSAVIPDKPGEGARALGIIREAGVNFLAIWAYPLKGRKSQIDMVPNDAAAFKKAAKKAGLELSKKQPAFLIQGDDHPGAVADALAKLAAAGINARAAQAVCGGSGTYGAMLEVEPDDVKKAAKALAR